MFPRKESRYSKSEPKNKMFWIIPLGKLSQKSYQSLWMRPNLSTLPSLNGCPASQHIAKSNRRENESLSNVMPVCTCEWKPFSRINRERDLNRNLSDTKCSAYLKALIFFPFF